MSLSQVPLKTLWVFVKSFLAWNKNKFLLLFIRFWYQSWHICSPSAYFVEVPCTWYSWISWWAMWLPCFENNKNPLTWPFHSIAYEIECDSWTAQSSEFIHRELGCSHSNYPETSHNVLIRFRSKDANIQCMHYMVTTNLRLLQAANMLYLYKKTGASYHWILDLFSCLRLPVWMVCKNLYLMTIRNITKI